MQRQRPVSTPITIGLAAAALLAAALPALATEIYRSVDEHGNPVFTDEQPDDDADPEELGDPIVVQPPPRREEARAGQGDEEGDEDNGGPPYDGARISFPPADEAVRRVSGLIAIRVELTPDGVGLAEGHRVRIRIDGEAVAEEAATEVTVGPLNPGPRQVQATIVDDGGATLVESKPIRFYLIRQTVN